jgi:dihydrolipoamide dehydrogenase
MKYDCVIIGGGPAGYRAAMKLTEIGKKSCIVEINENRIGGTCLNEGCIPVKTLLELKTFDQEQIKQTLDKNITRLRSGLLSALKNKNIDFAFGKAKFISTKKIELESENGKTELESDYFIIATGSLPKDLPDIKPDGKRIFNSSQLINSDLQVENILIIGGGYIGLEFATFYSSMGSKVTIAEARPRVLPDEDSEVSRTITREFKKQGIEILTDTEIKDIPQKFDKVLLAVGRVPNISGLGFEEIGIKTESGFIAVDSTMRTNIRNIFAAGDVINTPMLAHIAYREGTIAAEAITGFIDTRINYNAAPRIIFCSPQIGSAGITEDNAREKGLKIGVKKKFFKANPKAVILGQEAGFAKVVFDSTSRRILGGSIVGPQASELVHLLSMVVEKEFSIDEFGGAIYGHPALAEIFDNSF